MLAECDGSSLYGVPAPSHVGDLIDLTCKSLSQSFTFLVGRGDDTTQSNIVIKQRVHRIHIDEIFPGVVGCCRTRI